MSNRRLTTCATPLKWPGRVAPSITLSISPKSNCLLSGWGYISSTEGISTKSAPASSSRRASASGVRGVMLQVVFVVELRGVYEDAHHDGAVFPPGTFHERAVSCMQGAHRRYEADSRLLRLVQLCTELLDTFKYFHPFLMRVVRAKVEIPSDITKKKVGKISRIFFLCAPCRSEIPVFRPRRRMRFCKMRLSCEKGWHSLILFPDIA